MALRTLRLTQTSNGIRDHGRHLGRRALAKSRALSLGFGDPTITVQTAAGHGSPLIVDFVVDDRNDATLMARVQDLKGIFEYYGFVTVQIL
jgi:hypothetical protein